MADWLPITKKDAEQRGWQELDIILVSGDAYIDHPSFGTAVIARVLEVEGYKIGIIPQPNWQDDGRDFKKFGQPRLFFGVTAGSMDSMVNHYTAAKRKRSDDAYTPNNQAGFRPDYPTIVYTQMLKRFYPETPVVIGGIEASLRRFTHYDYWQNKLLPSMLVESGADLLVYGMGERPVVAIAKALANGENISDIRSIPQTVYLLNNNNNDQEKIPENAVVLPAHEDCLKSKKIFAESFKMAEQLSNAWTGNTLIQRVGKVSVVANPSYPAMATPEIDAVYDLPYTRLPHPKYNKRGVIPAYEMIRHSVNIHRGCFGGCSFCTISMHQGRQIASRSKESVLKEVDYVTKMDDFKGYLSDLGGPSANMYMMKGKDSSICETCKRQSCIYPSICNNLNNDHAALLELYQAAEAHPKVKKAFIGSGVRYDMLMNKQGDAIDNKHRPYAEHLIKYNVSGRLKVAPEHTEKHVLQQMRKPDFDYFKVFKTFFDQYCRKISLPQQLIPYFISSHPGCTQEDMRRLQEKTKQLGYKLEQVQDFTPTPMTLSTTIFYAGIDPYSEKNVFTAKSVEEKKAQNNLFFWYKKKS